MDTLAQTTGTKSTPGQDASNTKKKVVNKTVIFKLHNPTTFILAVS